MTSSLMRPPLIRMNELTVGGADAGVHSVRTADSARQVGGAPRLCGALAR